MPFQETDLGGRERLFPETTWGLVSQLAAQGDERWNGGMEEMCRRLGRNEEAIRDIEHALELDPKLGPKAEPWLKKARR